LDAFFDANPTCVEALNATSTEGMMVIMMMTVKGGRKFLELQWLVFHDLLMT